MNSEKTTIAVLGGTGNIGKGMVLRLALQNLMEDGVKNEVVIGSRTPETAKEAANEALEELENYGFDTSEIKITGESNTEAAKKADLLILTIRFGHVPSLLESIREDLENKILISPVVPMVKAGPVFEYQPPEEGSAAKAIQARVPESTKVVAAFHNVAARKLQDVVKCKAVHDSIICSDDEEAKKVVMKLTENMGCLKPLDGGPLSNANTVEALTPLLINIAKLNGLKDLGINFS